MRIVGRIIPFRELSIDLGGFREWIAPEAVDGVLSDGTDVRALVAHDSRMVLGRVGNGMLRLEKRASGLWAEIDPPQTNYADDVIESIRRGDAPGASWAFQVPEGGEEWLSRNGQVTRFVKNMEIREVSVGVTFPAYPQTTVSLRAAPAWPMHGPRLLSVARVQQRQAVLELRGLLEDAEPANEHGPEIAMTRWPNGDPVARPHAIRARDLFLRACVERYGTAEAIPRTTPRWSPQTGWEDRGAMRPADEERSSGPRGLAQRRLRQRQAEAE